jgi:hypothetical protein
MYSTIEQPRGYRFLRTLVGVLCVVAFSDLAYGQQEASIIGQVKDESGAILPGVTISATSPALQVPQVTDVTNQQGEYRLTPLPIGTYTITYTLQGFQTIRREEVRLTAGFTARVDITLKVGTLNESVTVSGAAPVVDVTSTTTRTELTRETLELIPTSRAGLQSVLMQAPGARTNLDTGSGVTANPTFRAFGRSYEAWVTVEGFPTTSPKSALQSTAQYFDYESFEETSVQTVGNNAETPNSGLNLNIILKSGGNDFHGQGVYTASAQKLQWNNLDQDLIKAGLGSPNKIATRWDADAAIGGPILHDKLWFFFTPRLHREDTQIAGSFKPDGTPGVDPVTQFHSTEKISYQLNPSNKFIGFTQAFHRDSQSGDTPLVPWNSRQHQIYGQQTSKIEWQLVKNNKYVSIQAGEWAFHLDRSGFDPTNISTFDDTTRRATGQNIDASTTTFEMRRAVTGVFSWYKADWLGGNHAFKFGLDYWDSHADRRSQDRGAATNMQLHFANGVPTTINALNYPVTPLSHVYNVPTFVQDSWTLARRLTLNLGVRYDHNWAYLPAQSRDASAVPLGVLYPAQTFQEIHFKTFNPVTPRAHLAWDVTGNGRTVVKGGWGRFSHMWNSDEINMANKMTFLTSTFLWHDLNGNRLFEPGEVNFDPAGVDFVSQSALGASAATSNAIPNPDLKQPGSQEFNVSVEQQLIANFAVRATGIYSRDTDTYRILNTKRPYDAYNIDVSRAIAAPNGTADPSLGTLPIRTFSRALGGLANQVPMLINDSKSDAAYTSFELAASRRLVNRWMMQASYSATKLNVPYVSNSMITSGSACIGCVDLTTYEPNAEIFAANQTWEYLTRLSGYYQLPWGVSASANYENRSGTRWARTQTFANVPEIGTLVLRVEPIGTRRMPNTNLLNVRFEKSIPGLAAGQKLALRANIYNTLNSNTPLSVQQNTGAAFGNVLTYMPPRILEFGVVYSY